MSQRNIALGADVWHNKARMWRSLCIELRDDARKLRSENNRLNERLQRERNCYGVLLQQFGDLLSKYKTMEERREAEAGVFDAAMEVYKWHMACARFLEGDSPNEPEDRLPMLEADLLAACETAGEASWD